MTYVQACKKINLNKYFSEKYLFKYLKRENKYIFFEKIYLLLN